MNYCKTKNTLSSKKGYFMKKAKDRAVFDEFAKMCPWAADKVVRWNSSDVGEIVVELDDGGVVQYDKIIKTWRFARNLQELKDLRTPTNEEEWKQEFSWRLYRKMVSKGLSQDDLAFEADISPASITKYMNGTSVPSAYNLLKIAKAMHLSIEDFAKITCLN